MGASEKKNRYQLVDGCPHDMFYISPIPVRPNGLLYEINRCGYSSQTQAGFCVKRTESYRFHVIHCVLRGSGVVEFRGKKYPVHARQLFILPNGEGHCYYADPDHAMRLLWVEFLGGDSDRLARYILDTGGPVFEAEAFDAVVKLCRTLVMEEKKNIAQTSEEIYSMLAELCRYCMEEEKRQNPVITEALNYIDGNLDKPLSQADVAKLFGYSPAYFSGLFSKAVGVPFSKYIAQRKINRACYLLMTTRWSVEQIASELGFYDVSHFMRHFKVAEGVTPMQYRREQWSTAGAD